MYTHIYIYIYIYIYLGYNTGVMNPSQGMVFPTQAMTAILWPVAVSAFAIGGPFGAFVGGTLANTSGRRGAMLINIWIFFIGGLIMTLAPNIYFIIPARLIVGFASGLNTISYIFYYYILFIYLFYLLM